MNSVSPRVFRAMQNIDIAELKKCKPKEIRPILPCLVRMSLISPLDNTKECNDTRKEILTLLSGIELVNSIVALLSIDFHNLESDVKKEQQSRLKGGASQTDSLLGQAMVNGLALEFERSDSTRRLRLVLSELLNITVEIQEQRGQEFFQKQSDLFDPVYLEEVSDVLSIALAELPSVMNICDLVETLLHLKHGCDVICWLVANAPDSFREVVTTLISNADKSEEENGGGAVRIQALTQLCQMNPDQALAVRAKCVELQRMPALVISLSLETFGRSSESDMVTFVTGLILGTDLSIRNWFGLFVRNGQKRKPEAYNSLQVLRDELTRRLKQVVVLSQEKRLQQHNVVQASSLLRLYCALRSVSGIKFQDEEVSLMVHLITSQPPPTPAGVRFVSIGLCMLIACPSLIATPDHESRSIQWVKWLANEEAYFKSSNGATASFGEMLLLMAIHFHSNQLSAICDLVCQVLGVKVPIRPNNMTRLRQIFTQEIFTEQVVTAHAVKVPVTGKLNADFTGFLPVHCIHQLLKSRAFTKHKVPIKKWIYKQICSCVAPLHNVMPGLIEVYVNSILIPSQKSHQENTNQPISIQEIRAVYKDSVVTAIPANKRDLKNSETSGESYSLTAQLLILYYLLLYEDVRLTNAQTISSSGRKVLSYSTEFLSELPIKYLLHKAEEDQQSYGTLFSQLLKLLATHFPHLSLVDDWLNDILLQSVAPVSEETTTLCNATIEEAFERIITRPLWCGQILKHLIALPPTKAWDFADTFVRHFKSVLDERVPRYLQELYKQVWLRLNTVLPRTLWLKSINALLHEETAIHNVSLTQENINLDPLQVLRCDTRVFRCAPVLTIVLRTLEASLAASRSQLTRHVLERPLPPVPPGGNLPAGSKSGPLSTEVEREELKAALIAAQESAALQILLEACLETKEDRTTPGQMWALREVRSVVCSHLHQAFIAEPPLAKLVHFQGYPSELLQMTTEGVPSMHICLDWLPELIGQPCLSQQIFAVELVSHLSLRYCLTKSMSVARLALNTMSTLLLGVLSHSDRVAALEPLLPAFVRIARAFPPLVEDVVSLLAQLARVCASHSALGQMASQRAIAGVDRGATCWLGMDTSGLLGATSSGARGDDEICQQIKNTFGEILSQAVFKKDLY